MYHSHRWVTLPNLVTLGQMVWTYVWNKFESAGTPSLWVVGQGHPQNLSLCWQLCKIWSLNITICRQRGQKKLTAPGDPSLAAQNPIICKWPTENLVLIGPQLSEASRWWTDNWMGIQLKLSPTPTASLSFPPHPSLPPLSFFILTAIFQVDLGLG